MQKVRDATQKSASWPYRLKRWLYRGDRPNRLARLMNRPQAALHSAGIITPDNWVTMEVRGRRSGRLISFPLVAADYQGERYLVAMLGQNANWVRNVQAAQGRVVLRHGRREAVRLEEVDPGSRAPILRRYLALTPGARPHIPVSKDAPLEEFERIAPQIPVFRITPTSKDPTTPVHRWEAPFESTSLECIDVCPVLQLPAQQPCSRGLMARLMLPVSTPGVVKCWDSKRCCA